MIFPRNLLALSSRYRSISEFSSKIEIERTKLSRLLKGQTAPSTEVLARICAHFGVDANILFVELTPSDIAKGRSPALDPAKKSYDQFQAFSTYLTEYFTDEIETGWYFSYYRSFRSRRVGKSLIQLKKERNGYSYKSFCQNNTIENNIATRAPGPVRFRYTGIACCQEDHIYIYYFDPIYKDEIGMMSLTGSDYNDYDHSFIGCQLATTNQKSKRVACADVVMQPIDTSLSVLQAARSTGFYSDDSISLPPEIYQALEGAHKYAAI